MTGTERHNTINGVGPQVKCWPDPSLAMEVVKTKQKRTLATWNFYLHWLPFDNGTVTYVVGRKSFIYAVQVHHFLLELTTWFNIGKLLMTSIPARAWRLLLDVDIISSFGCCVSGLFNIGEVFFDALSPWPYSDHSAIEDICHEKNTIQ